jgi:hypothetical protein
VGVVLQAVGRLVLLIHCQGGACGSCAEHQLQVVGRLVLLIAGLVAPLWQLTLLDLLAREWLACE